jgi:hypothetical protein
VRKPAVEKKDAVAQPPAMTELEQLRAERDEAFEQLTAISDVLGAISGSVFDLDAVLRTIAERAIALCRADTCAGSPASSGCRWRPTRSRPCVAG